MKYNHLQPVNEVYFGNSPELEAMLLQLHKVREIAMQDNANYFVRVNTHPELLKLNRMFEQFFGFKTFAIHIEQTKKFNASTMAISSRIDTPIIRAKHMEATSVGFRLKSSCKYSAMLLISTGLLNNEKFSDREILAIMFHEIGHNFASSGSINTCILNAITKPIILLATLLNIFRSLKDKGILLSASTDITLTFYNNSMEKLKTHNPGLIQGLNMWFGLKGVFGDVIAEFKQIFKTAATILTPISSVLFKPFKMVKSKINPLSLLKSLMGREDERFADNFASLYGLGPDLARALTKVNDFGYGIKTREIVNDLGFIGTLYNCISMPAEFVCGIFDEHPNIEARCYQQIRYLEQELEKEDMDPKMKEQIKSDLKDLESTIEQYLYANKHSGVAARRMVAGLFYEMSGGDVRDLFHHKNKATSKNIDKLYDKTKIKESVNLFDTIDIR